MAQEKIMDKLIKMNKINNIGTIIDTSIQLMHSHQNQKTKLMIKQTTRQFTKDKHISVSLTIKISIFSEAEVVLR